jgi:hypothetical protein
VNGRQIVPILSPKIQKSRMRGKVRGKWRDETKGSLYWRPVARNSAENIVVFKTPSVEEFEVNISNFSNYVYTTLKLLKPRSFDSPSSHDYVNI